MSDRTRRTAWEGIKKNLQKPFVRKRKNAFQASRRPASMSEDPTWRSVIPVVIGNNAREDVYHESRTEVQTQNTGSDYFDEAFVSPYLNLHYSEASRRPASMSEDPTWRSVRVPVVIGNNAREDVYHESRTEVQTQNTGSDYFDEAFVSPYLNLHYSEASRRPASMSEDPTWRSVRVPVVIGNNAREDQYHESRTEVQTQNTGSDFSDEEASSDDDQVPEGHLSGKTAVALYDFCPEDKEEMFLRKGDTITLNGTSVDGWWLGECGDARGYIPSNYVKIIEKKEPVERQHTSSVAEKRAVALYDFDPVERGDMILRIGDIITVNERTGIKDWWMGKRGKTRGLIPSNYVKILNEEDVEPVETQHTSSVPLDILTRGPLALKAYEEALTRGETSVRRVPLMLIGQGGAGKTSTKKSLKGICFDPNEERTVGIDMDLSHFKVSTETWRSGEQGQDQNSDTAIYLDYHLARCIADSLKTQENTTQRNTDTNFLDSEIIEVPGQPITTEDSSEGENIKKPSTVQKEEAAVAERFPRGVLNDKEKELIQESHGLSISTVPEEVAAATERFLRGDVDDNKEDIYFTFWDFAGQSVYYVTHPLFLTARAMFLLVYDLSLNPDDEAKPVLKQGVYEESEESSNIKTNFDYLDFWMRSVASLASGQAEGSRLEETTSVKLPPVFLVCTHADKPYGRGDPRKLALKIFGCLKRKPYGAHLCDVFWIDNTSLRASNSDCPEVVRLRHEIFAVAKELHFINETIPINWLKFEKALQAKKEVGNKRISLESARDIAENDCNIVDEKEFETLMNFLHDIRSLIHYEDTVQLNKLVVLDPQWLVDVFKKVITVKPYDPQEKEFLHLWRKLESKGVLDEKLVAHVWGPLFEDKETLESLIGIMERFSLLCPWSVHASSNSQYLVPSMLKAYPSADILELVKSAHIPSLFVKFSNGEVPPAFFPRLVVQFIQWGRERFWSEETPQLFMGFARFYTSEDACSVIFICNSSSVEVVVHGGNLAPFLPSSGGETCARKVCRQLSLILECMRNQFPWLENMTYELCVICPVCSKEREVAFCPAHGTKICKQEQCLHFWTVSELCSDTRNIHCRRFAVARDTTVEISQFSPWFPAPKEQLGTDECDGDPFALDEGNQEKALAVRSSVFEHLSSKSCDAELVVSKLKETLRLDQASLEQPDSDTKKQIRCLAREAIRSNRPDVVEYLREITPAGTTGPLLPESLDVRGIPFSQARQLTIDLTVADGDKWKFVAEKLGLNAGETRFLDERNKNPVEALLAFVANQRKLSVGELYQVLCDCGIPVIADQL